MTDYAPRGWHESAHVRQARRTFAADFAQAKQDAREVRCTFAAAVAQARVAAREAVAQRLR